MLMQKVLTGVKSREWCYTLIQNMKLIALGGPSIAICRVLNG